MSEKLCHFRTCLCNSYVNNRSLVLLWEVPRSCSEGEAAIILLGHFIDTNSFAICQPNNKSPEWKDKHPESLRNRDLSSAQ